MYQIEHYLTPNTQKDAYLDWLLGLRDRQAQIAVIRRVARMEQGNFGDHKFCRDGVWELRVDTGKGYRVYYAQADRHLILLLCGGGKHTQKTDISQATDYWHDWQLRDDNAKQTS